MLVLNWGITEMRRVEEKYLVKLGKKGYDHRSWMENNMIVC